MLVREKRSLRIVAFLRERPVATVATLKKAIQITHYQTSQIVTELCKLDIVRSGCGGYKLNDGLTDDDVMAILNISDWNEGNKILRLPIDDPTEDTPDRVRHDKIEILRVENRVVHVLSSWSSLSKRKTEKAVKNALSGVTPNSVFERK